MDSAGSNISSVLKRKSVFRAISTSRPLDSLKDPLNLLQLKALSKSSYFTHREDNDTNFNNKHVEESELINKKTRIYL